jgi:hypothetical protein
VHGLPGADADLSAAVAWWQPVSDSPALTMVMQKSVMSSVFIKVRCANWHNDPNSATEHPLCGAVDLLLSLRARRTNGNPDSE